MITDKWELEWYADNRYCLGCEHVYMIDVKKVFSGEVA